MFLYLQLTERDPLWRREMRERWRRPITLFFVTLYVASLCWFGYSLYSALVPAGGVELGQQSRGIGHQIFVSLLGLQIGTWIPVAILLAAPTVAAERERRTLTEYVLAGLRPRQIVRAKFASIVTFIIVMCAVPLPILSLCFPLGGVEPLELFAGVIFETAIAIICASMGLLISTNNRRVTSAMQQGIVLSLVLLLLAAIIVPGLLELSFWLWLLFAAFLILISTAFIAGCEDSLSLVSRHLEQEEVRTELPLSTYPASPPPPPIPVQRATPIAPQPPVEKTIYNELWEGSSWDVWVEKVAAFNAITLREVRVGLRTSRQRMALSPDKPAQQFSPWAWIFIGALGAVVVAATEMAAWWYFGLVAVGTLTTVAATSGASAAFTREREQKMLSQLQMCPLSPLEIVIGKIGAMLLLVTRSWGGPLLGVLVMGFSQGVEVAVGTAVVVVLGLLLAVTVATLLSLVCRHTAIASGGALGVLLVVFVLLPIAPNSLIYYVPAIRTLITSFPIGTMWIDPMRAFLMPSSTNIPNSPSHFEALLKVTCSLVFLNALLVLLATRFWSRGTADEGEAKTRFWERDISRSWR